LAGLLGKLHPLKPDGEQKRKEYMEEALRFYNLMVSEKNFFKFSNFNECRNRERFANILLVFCAG